MLPTERAWLNILRLGVPVSLCPNGTTHKSLGQVRDERRPRFGSRSKIARTSDVAETPNLTEARCRGAAIEV